MAVRLARYLSERGLGSRRKAETWILAGRVRVNGVVTTDLARRVEPGRDKVCLDGSEVPAAMPRRRVLLLWKPAGYLTTMSDPFGRPTVRDLVPPELGRLYPVGRLDLDSEGALLLTNDGELAHRFTHPRFHLPKTYLVEVEGRIEAGAVERLRRGIMLEDGPTSPAEVELRGFGRGTSRLQVTLYEGRKRQLKRMLAAVGHPVRRLRRVGIGPLDLRGLRPGEYRELTEAELAGLMGPAERR